MKKIYTASLPNSAALRADSGQMGTEILMPASSIGIPQKFTTVLTPQQVALIGTEALISLNIPNSLYSFVSGYVYYEYGEGFETLDISGGSFVITNTEGFILVREKAVDIAPGEISHLKPAGEGTSPAVIGPPSKASWILFLDTAPTGTNLGRLQITLYLIPLDLEIP